MKMIYCNLSVLFAERKVKISKVSTETGISRTTLTALALNNWQGVRADTVNALCKYLNVTVGDVFQFIPFDIEVGECSYQQQNNMADVTFKCSADNFSGDIHCSAVISVQIPSFPEKIHTLNVSIIEYDPESAKEEYENALICRIFKALPISIITGIKSDVANGIIESIVRTSNTEVDGEICGFPESSEMWEAYISLPDSWKKEGKN